jgi:hypothetical protein
LSIGQRRDRQPHGGHRETEAGADLLLVYLWPAQQEWNRGSEPESESGKAAHPRRGLAEPSQENSQCGQYEAKANDREESRYQARGRFDAE